MTIRKGQRRRWCIPPAMTYAPGETLEGASLLAELQGDFGVLLWRTVRDLSLWVATPPRARAGLFAPASTDVRLARLAMTDVPPRIAAPLDTIQGMLTRADRADAGVLAICCLEIAAWAREAGVPHTSVAFAQAGALVSPDFAAAALLTGMAAFAVQQDARAATWFRRAVALARRERDWATYAAGSIEAATVEERQGTAERAEQLFRLASRAARRFKNSDVYLRAEVGLFRLARRRGEGTTAAAHARSVGQAFRREVEPGPDVLLDLARFWMEAGDLRAARSALRRLVPRRVELPREAQLSLWALVAACSRRPTPGSAAPQPPKPGRRSWIPPFPKEPPSPPGWTWRMPRGRRVTTRRSRGRRTSPSPWRRGRGRTASRPKSCGCGPRSPSPPPSGCAAPHDGDQLCKLPGGHPHRASRAIRRAAPAHRRVPASIADSPQGSASGVVSLNDRMLRCILTRGTECGTIGGLWRLCANFDSGLGRYSHGTLGEAPGAGAKQPQERQARGCLQTR